jgi:hypothetical protein
MTYCTNAKLTQMTGTALSTTIQDALILEADYEINGWLYQAGLTPPASDTTLEVASLKLSTTLVMTRHRMDGTQPGSLSVGEFSMSDNIDAAIASLRDSARQLVDSYIAKVKTASYRSTRVYKVNG